MGRATVCAAPRGSSPVGLLVHRECFAKVLVDGPELPQQARQVLDERVNGARHRPRGARATTASSGSALSYPPMHQATSAPGDARSRQPLRCHTQSACQSKGGLGAIRNTRRPRGREISRPDNHLSGRHGRGAHSVQSSRKTDRQTGRLTEPDCLACPPAPPVSSPYAYICYFIALVNAPLPFCPFPARHRCPRTSSRFPAGSWREALSAVVR